MTEAKVDDIKRRVTLIESRISKDDLQSNTDFDQSQGAFNQSFVDKMLLGHGVSKFAAGKSTAMGSNHDVLLTAAN